MLGQPALPTALRGLGVLACLTARSALIQVRSPLSRRCSENLGYGHGKNPGPSRARRSGQTLAQAQHAGTRSPASRIAGAVCAMAAPWSSLSLPRCVSRAGRLGRKHQASQAAAASRRMRIHSIHVDCAAIAASAVTPAQLGTCGAHAMRPHLRSCPELQPNLAVHNGLTWCNSCNVRTRWH